VTFPTVAVDVSFSTGPFDTPSWTSIVGDVKAVSTSTGRSARFGEFEPGEAEVTLNNRARKFDPLHAAGPYFGDLKPNKRVRVRATYDGTTYEVFTGFVNGWPQSYSAPSEAVSVVRAVDGFKLLERARMPDDQYGVEVLADSPRLWYRFDETSGREIRDSSGNGRHALASVDTSVAAADGGLIASANGSVKLDGATWDVKIPKEHLAFDYDPCSVEFWFQCDKPPQTPGINGIISGSTAATGLSFHAFILYADPEATISSTPQPGGFLYCYIQQNDTLASKYLGATSQMCDGLPHHVLFTRSGNTLKIYVDGVDRSSLVLTSGFSATTGSELDLNLSYGDSLSWPKWEGASSPILDEFAIYDTALSAADALRHYQAGLLLWDGDHTGERLANILDTVGWPAADRDIDTGQSVLGPASWPADTKALDLGRLIEATEQGTLYIDHRDAGKLRFRDRHALLTETASTTSQATFTDELADTTNVHYSGIEIDYDELEIINSVTVAWVGGTVTRTDDTSIDDNREQSIKIDTLVTTQDEAEGIGDWVLAHLAEPQVRIRSITIKATGRDGTAADATWEQVLGRKFGDRITVIRHPQGIGDPIEADVIIDGIDHQIGGTGDAGGINTWTTTFRCSPAEAVDYWIVGTSAVGVDTRAAL